MTDFEPYSMNQFNLLHGRFYLLIVLFTLFHLQGTASVDYFSSDSIPPVITTPSQNFNVNCNLAIEDSLSAWYDRRAGTTAEDESSPVVINSTIPVVEALNRLDLDQSLKCGTTGSVMVGWYAIDTCGNRSDTSFASFSIIDTTGPLFTVQPIDLTVNCNASKRDSLNRWISRFGRARINDECSNLESFVQYIWNDSEGNSGTGSYSIPPNLNIDITSCDYEMAVTFIAEDECGNRSNATATFRLIDTLAPLFESEVPDTLIVNCDNIPSARNVNVIDDCAGTLVPVIRDVSTQDPDDSTCGFYNYRIDRTYTATDFCGNTSVMTQIIFVADTLEPRFVAPPDTIISDIANPDPEVTGFPIDIIDNCSSEVSISYSDVRTASTCRVNIDRRWNIQDLCGSSLVLSQQIVVLDSMPPVIISPTINILLDCSTPIDIASGFDEWIRSFGSTVVRDEISTIAQSFAAVPGSYDVNDPNTWPGTDPGELDDISCPSGRPGLLRYEDVDFVFIDACGNALVSRGTFGITDSEAPNFTSSVEDTMIFINDIDDCTATFRLTPLVLTDDCAGGESQSFTTRITSITAESSEVPVNPVTLTFGPFDADFITNADPIELVITLNNVDANNPTEFFNVRSESGNIIGRTNNSLAQCGNVNTSLFFSRADLLSWIEEDRLVTFVLEPNIISGVPTLSINTVCSNSNAVGRLNMTRTSEFSLFRTVKINSGAERNLNAPIDTVLSVGRNRIVYIGRDCAQNMDSLVQIITVADTLSTAIRCPRDTIINLSPGSCTADITLPANILNAGGCSASLTLQSIDVSGTTIISSDNISIVNDSVRLSLQKGSNQIRYTFIDEMEMVSTCMYNINVRDIEFPRLVCASDISLQIDPEGSGFFALDTSALILEASENCAISRIEIFGTDITCDQIGQTVNLLIQVTDDSGNRTQCNTSASVIPFELVPTNEPILCLGDSLKLFANAPNNSTNTFTYFWTGPNGFTSDSANPVIADASDRLSGVYNITITSESGCATDASLTVDVEEFASPDIRADKRSICLGEQITLSTTLLPTSIQYFWYEGIYPDGDLIDSNNDPFFRLTPELGTHYYYLIIKSSLCETNFEPSDSIRIDVFERPDVGVTDSLIQICSGQSIQLRGTGSGQGITHQWRGPGGYNSEQLMPPPITDISSAQAGIYTLINSRGGCTDSASVRVEVINQLPTPVITSEKLSYCEGEPITLSITNYMADDAPQYRWLLNGRSYLITDKDSLVIFSADSTHQGEWRVIALDSICNSDTSDLYRINVNSRITLSISHDNPICESDSLRLSIPSVDGASYLWTGPEGFTSAVQNPVTTAIEGFYSVQITNASACSNTFSTFVRVEPNPFVVSIFADFEKCASGFNSTFLNTSIFPDDNIIYSWRGPNNYTSTSSRATVSNYTSTSNGYYYLTVSRFGCISKTDSFLFEVTDIPIKPSISAPNRVCSGDSVTLTISSPQSNINQYNWVTPKGIIATPSPFLTIPIVNQEDAGQYYVNANRNGCISTSSDTFNLSVFRLPSIPTVITNSPLCQGEELTLEVLLENNTTYEWIGPEGFSSTENRITLKDFNPDSIDKYQVRIFRNGCPSAYSSAENIDFLNIPAAPVIESSDQDICQGQTATLELCVDRSSFVAGVEYVWINTTNGEALGRTNDLCLRLNSFIDLIPGVNNIVARRILNGCESEDSAPVIVELFGLPDISARAGEDLTVCNPDNIRITATEPLRGTGRWTSPDARVSFSNPNAFSTFVFGLQEGENILIWSLSNGPCMDYSTDEKIVTLESEISAEDDLYNADYGDGSPAELDILINDEYPDGFNITILSQPRSGEVVIDDANNLILYKIDPRFVGEVSFTYELCSTTCTDNCDRASVKINVGDSNDCFAPTIITPNGDGMNDNFIIPCIESGLYNANELYIYNQWGDEVYYSQSYQNNWAGTYNGKDLPTGTYYYIFIPDPATDPVKGFLIIER